VSLPVEQFLREVGDLEDVAVPLEHRPGEPGEPLVPGVPDVRRRFLLGNLPGTLCLPVGLELLLADCSLGLGRECFNKLEVVLAPVLLENPVAHLDGVEGSVGAREPGFVLGPLDGRAVDVPGHAVEVVAVSVLLSLRNQPGGLAFPKPGGPPLRQVDDVGVDHVAGIVPVMVEGVFIDRGAEVPARARRVSKAVSGVGDPGLVVELVRRHQIPQEGILRAVHQEPCERNDELAELLDRHTPLEQVELLGGDLISPLLGWRRQLVDISKLSGDHNRHHFW